MLYLPGEAISDLSWEGTGTQLCFAIDSHIFFTKVRYDYKVSVLTLNSNFLIIF